MKPKKWKSKRKEIYKATIPGQLWDLNDMINLAKTHWAAYRDKKAKLQEKVGWCLIKAIPPQIQKIGMKIAWYESDMSRNKDNIVAGGLKLILDALVEDKVIQNDGWKEIGTIDAYNFEVDKDNPRIEVNFWEEGE